MSVESLRKEKAPIDSVKKFSNKNGGTSTEGICAYSEQIQSILNRPHLQALAEEAGFCKRQRKLLVGDFFCMLLYCANSHERGSLTLMCSLLSSQSEVEISKQGLDKRFNEQCVNFVKAVLQEFLQDHCQRVQALYDPGFLGSFNHVRVKDSTKFMIPDTLKEHYKGVGGRAGEAGMSIQFEYDIKSGKVLDLTIGPGCENDRADAGKTAWDVEEKDLVIRDLGYFSRTVFQAFADKGAFFLSRLDSSSIVVVDKGRKRLSFSQLYKDMVKKKISRQEIAVLIGSDKQVVVRLVVEIVPERVYVKRLENRTRANKTNSRKKHRKNQEYPAPQIKDETKARYRFNLYITNADAASLPAAQIYTLYRIRWQVELMFKSWKGTFHIDKISKMKEERYLCLLYAKLILIVINLQIIYRVQQSLCSGRQAKQTPVLSIDKSLKTLHALFELLMVILYRGKQQRQATACKIQQIVASKRHWLEQRRDKLSLPQIIELFICKTEK